jgi:hypothetical protein
MLARIYFVSKLLNNLKLVTATCTISDKGQRKRNLCSGNLLRNLFAEIKMKEKSKEHASGFGLKVIVVIIIAIIVITTTTTTTTIIIIIITFVSHFRLYSAVSCVNV